MSVQIRNVLIRGSVRIVNTSGGSEPEPLTFQTWDQETFSQSTDVAWEDLTVKI